MSPSAAESSIYVLIDPRDQEIRYVGVTVQPIEKRLLGHLKYKGRDHRSDWVQHLRRRGLKPMIRLVQVVPNDHRAEAEQYWIAYFKSLGCDLTNGTRGGQGRLGSRWTDEQKAAKSRQMKGRPSWKKGMTGLATPETRAKISAAAKRQFEDPDQRAKVSRVHKGKTLSEAQKRAVGDAARLRWEAWRAEGRTVTDEQRERMRVAARLRAEARQQAS